MGPRRKKTGEVLSRRALNRALLERQLLLRRQKLSALQVLERLVGIQSQAPNPPYFGLWTRVARFKHAELSRAIQDREAVRIALMRSTIHLVTAADCLWLRPLVQPVHERAFKGNYGRYLAGMELKPVIAAGRKLLEQQPLTFDALGKQLASQFPGKNPTALWHALRTFAPLVQVPPRGLWGSSGPAAHTTAEAWLGRPLEPKPKIEALVLRYLTAFGPASVRDAQTWSGLAGLAEVMEGLRPRLRVFLDERGRELFDLPDAPRPSGDVTAPARFLGEFDNVLLSHDDRSRILTVEQKKRIFSVNGLISSVVLVDGFVAGVWKLAKEKAKATLTVESFGSLAKGDREQLAEEGEALLAFAAEGVGARSLRFASTR
jgi:hypothetical protein